MSEIVRINPKADAFLGVDVTPTFMPGGGLAVPGGDEIVPGVARVAALFDAVYWTEDEHPHGHISLFSSYSAVAPFTDLTPELVADWGENRIASPYFDLAYLKRYVADCIGGKQTAWTNHGLPHWTETRLHPALRGISAKPILIKGTDPGCDSYSAFRDNLGRPTGMAAMLRSDGVSRVFCAGLAFNFCVGYSAKDAKAMGFETYVIEDLTRSVPIPGTAERMRQELLDMGVRLIASGQLVRE
jgi:nicotinamidase/pyrazinamidase